MKLSIITINLNNKLGLANTIESVANQTFQAFEYIVIDGQSKDGSVSLLDSANKRIDKWISEKDSGVYEAMNKGIQLADGEYLLFLNSGDLLHSAKSIENMISNLTADIVYGDLVFANEGSSSTYYYPEKLTIEFLFESTLGHPSTFIRRDLFKQFGNYNTNYKIASDWMFFLTCILKGHVSTRHVNQVVSVFDTNGISSDPKNQPMIREERTGFLKEEFPLFYEEHLKHMKCKNTLGRIQSSKGFRILKKLGVKKFQ
ncbi:glycosyltransferase family 2 protein [Sphingobacterium tabacisoli]|uniref:Glycosyltransferase family 2 protein n=1 Tax=Sphingobacterium tabacisoli TaxID=2044855 RepID=A0ABW5KX40_9SPHI|nr:glycosyltransferase family 2 protein [Sphingobacterium tabacisoli]